MHADMTAVTIQSNKIVSNDVEDNEALLDLPYRKKEKENEGTFRPAQDAYILFPLLQGLC